MDDDLQGKVKGLAEKTWWDKTKEFLAPGKVVQAQPGVDYTPSNHTSQYEQDMQLPQSERLKKIQKGFLGE